MACSLKASTESSKGKCIIRTTNIQINSKILPTENAVEPFTTAEQSVNSRILKLLLKLLPLILFNKISNDEVYYNNQAKFEHN